MSIAFERAVSPNAVLSTVTSISTTWSVRLLAVLRRPANSQTILSNIAYAYSIIVYAVQAVDFPF